MFYRHTTYRALASSLRKKISKQIALALVALFIHHQTQSFFIRNTRTFSALAKVRYIIFTLDDTKSEFISNFTFREE